MAMGCLSLGCMTITPENDLFDPVVSCRLTIHSEEWEEENRISLSTSEVSYTGYIILRK